ncbi:hypothetical protein PWT90_08792 [Aphanocladium album]|nr:hypothetical protein PWT90_08792 [Aphanocladium album]
MMWDASDPCFCRGVIRGILQDDEGRQDWLLPIKDSRKKKTTSVTHNMSPTYTMSAHFCRQVYSSWRETRRGSTPSATSRDTPDLGLAAVKSNTSSPSPRSSFSSVSSDSSSYSRPSSSSSDR